MKNTKSKILSAVSLVLIACGSAHAGNAENADEEARLRQEIQEQELVLEALKEELEALEQGKEKVFAVSVAADGLEIRGRAVSMDELEKQLGELSEDTKVLIRAKPSVTYKRMLSVMDLCAEAGLVNVVIAMAEEEKGGGDPG